MALVRCLECGKKISSKATACPQCGNPDIPSPGRIPHAKYRSLDEVPKKFSPLAVGQPVERSFQQGREAAWEILEDRLEQGEVLYVDLLLEAQDRPDAEDPHARVLGFASRLNELAEAGLIVVQRADQGRQAIAHRDFRDNLERFSRSVRGIGGFKLSAPSYETKRTLWKLVAIVFYLGAAGCVVLGIGGLMYSNRPSTAAKVLIGALILVSAARAASSRAK